MSNVPNYKLNGSSSNSSRSSSPEPNVDQPLAQILEDPEERVPTPFPIVQQPIDQPVGELPPLPLVMPVPRSPARSPARHQPLNQQPSNSGSSSSDRNPPPIPLSPTVHVIHYYPYSLSGSSSAVSFEAVGHLIQRLREDRRMNEEMRSRSVASGLYEFANMMMPQLPEYESPIYDDESYEDDETRRRRRRENRRFFYGMCVATGLISSALIGQQIGNIIFNWNFK